MTLKLIQRSHKMLMIEPQQIIQPMCHLQVIKESKYKSTHPLDNLLTYIHTCMKPRSWFRNFCVFFSFMPYIKPKYYTKALEDPHTH